MFNMGDRIQDCVRTGHGSMFGGGFMGTGFMIILWVILIGVIAYFIITRSNNNTVSKSKSAIEVLEIEFAKGNITEEEYIRKRDLLK